MKQVNYRGEDNIRRYLDFVPSLGERVMIDATLDRCQAVSDGTLHVLPEPLALGRIAVTCLAEPVVIADEHGRLDGLVVSGPLPHEVALN